MQNQLSEYMKLLPTYFQKEGGDFLNQFLKGFEELLSKSYGLLVEDDVSNTLPLEFKNYGNVNSAIQHAIHDIEPKNTRNAYQEMYNDLSQDFKDFFDTTESLRWISALLAKYFKIDDDEDDIELQDGRTIINFIGDFEAILLSYNQQTNQLALQNFIPEEKLIENIENYFDPAYTPAQFLDWLASWFLLKLKRGEDYNHPDDMLERDNSCGQIPPFARKIEATVSGGTTIYQLAPDDEARVSYNRKLIAKIFELNLKKGTRTGLDDYLKFYIDNIGYYADTDNVTRAYILLGGGATPAENLVVYEIHEFLYPCTIRDATGTSDPKYKKGLFVGKTTVVHEKEPYFFWVDVTIKHNNIELIQKIKTDIAQLIEEEKPAHTYYALTFRIKDMHISGTASGVVYPDLLTGYNSTIGGIRQEI